MRTRRWAGGLLLAVGAAIPAATPLTRDAHGRPGARGPGAPALLRTLDVAPHPGPGRALGAHLVGLSIEWPLLARDLGPAGTPPAGLVDVLRLLGRPALRIGGNSQDRMWPVMRHRPLGAVWTPTPAFWRGLGRLDRAAAGRVIVGLDLAHDAPSAVRGVAAAARAALPPGRLTFALGNEPDRYGVQAWARLRDHRVVTARLRNWSFAAYLRDYRRVLAAAGPVGAIAGPDFADARWRAALPRFLAVVRPREATIHAYPLAACPGRRRAGSRPTPRRLLLRAAWAGEIERGVAWAAADARRAHVPLVVSEANSVACRGARGVSDGVAAALWAPAFVLSAAQAGASEVAFHASDSVYDPFHVDARGDVAPSPLLAGLLLTVRALGPAPHLVPATIAPEGAPAWVLRGADGRLRVLVENLDPRRRLLARIRLPAAYGFAAVEALTAAGRGADGRPRMALDGQVLASRGGRILWAGRAARRSVPIVRGRARVVLPPLSAAIVATPGPADPSFLSGRTW